jgi:hypothetical protein
MTSLMAILPVLGVQRVVGSSGYSSCSGNSIVLVVVVEVVVVVVEVVVVVVVVEVVVDVVLVVV